MGRRGSESRSPNLHSRDFCYSNTLIKLAFRLKRITMGNEKTFYFSVMWKKGRSFFCRLAVLLIQIHFNVGNSSWPLILTLPSQTALCSEVKQVFKKQCISIYFICVHVKPMVTRNFRNGFLIKYFKIYYPYLTLNFQEKSIYELHFIHIFLTLLTEWLISVDILLISFAFHLRVFY